MESILISKKGQAGQSPRFGCRRTGWNRPTKKGWYWMSKKKKIIAIVVVIIGIGAGWAISYAIKKGWNQKNLQMLEE